MNAAPRRARQRADAGPVPARTRPPDEPAPPITPQPRAPNRPLLAAAVVLFVLWSFLLLLLVLSVR
jgi:hypothetical protein